MSTKLSDKIKQLRKERNMTLEEVGKAVGVGKSTVRKWETGMIANMRRDKIAALAEALGTTPSYLMGWDENSNYAPNIYPVATKRLPVLGEIACGKPIFTNEEHEIYIDASSDIKADFCLIAKGDSMIGARIHNGDVVFIRSQPTVDNGEIAAVIIGEEATLKRWYYYPEKNKLVLSAENPAYEPLAYVGEELTEIRCLGKAVSFMSNL